MRYWKMAVVSGIIFIAGWGYLQIVKISHYDLSRTAYRIGQDVRINWEKLCLSSGYTIPSSHIVHSDDLTCLVTSEVPEYQVYASYFNSENMCVTHKFSGYLIVRHNLETRCFDRNEVEGDTLVQKDMVIQFGDAEDR